MTSLILCNARTTHAYFLCVTQTKLQIYYETVHKNKYIK